MPASLNINVFIFGAVLVLLSLAVGKFKLWGVQVEGTVGKIGRVIAFLLGIVLIVAYLNRSQVDGQQPRGPTAPTSSTADGRGKPELEKPETEKNNAEKVKAYMLGTWDFDVEVPSTKIVYAHEIAFLSDGTFSETIEVNSFLQGAINGNWSVLDSSSDSFTLQLKSAGEKPKVVALRAIDPNTAKDPNNVVFRRK